MPRLAIIHTTPATVEPLKALAAERIPGVEVVNFVDDSILPQLAANGGNLAEVGERLLTYARFAKAVGAEVVLEACSSVGELAPAMQEAAALPVIRIDEAMAEEAVRRGRSIGVAATLATTLEPTTRLLRDKAAKARGAVEVKPRLVEGAYAALMAGDREGHDARLLAALSQLAAETDVVVLSQASMARVLPRLPEDVRDRCLVSPPLAIERVAQAFERGPGSGAAVAPSRAG